MVRFTLMPSSQRRQQGAVTVLLGFTLVVLIGFAGLAIDLGRFFVVKSELQNAVDACALAAASQLRPGQNNASALTKAVAYGRLFSTGGLGNLDAIKNRANFQSEVVAIAADQITFSDTINGTYLDSSSANYNTAAYAKCSYPLSGLPIYFMQLINPDFVSQTVSAMAVATQAPSASVCAIPVGVCKASGGTASNNYNLTPGQWLVAKGAAPYGTGNFGWIDFTPPNGGANELADLLQGSGQCEMVAGAKVGEQGQKTSLDVAWNSRFGVYKNGGGNPSLSDAPPDFTGYAYSTDSKSWPSAFNAYSGTPTVPGVVNFQTARSGHLAYQSGAPFGTSGGYSAVSSANLVTYGRDRRLAVAPVVDCSVWNTSGNAQPSVEGWACVLMLSPMNVGSAPNEATLEYIGLSNVAGSPCASSGAAGTAGPLVPVMAQ